MRKLRWIEFLKDEVLGQFHRSDRATRMAIWVLLVLQLPLINIVCNRTFLEWDIDRSPYEHMHQIDHIRTGQPVYAPLSTTHVSITYTPMYWWVCGGVCKILGPSLVWPRLVSGVCAVVVAWLIAAFVWKNTERNLLLSLAAPCFVLSTYSFINPWMIDVGLNSMHIAFGVLGFYLLMGELNQRNVVLSAIAMSLCVLTKQTGLAYVVASAFLLLFRSRKMCLWYVGVAGVLIAGICFVLNVSTHGEFYNQVFVHAKGPPWILSRLWEEVISRQTFGLFGLMLAMGMVPLLRARKKEVWPTLLRPEYVLAGAGIGVACIAHPKLGSGALHGLMEFAGLSICGCIGLCQLSKHLPVDWGRRLVISVVLLQQVIVLAPALNSYPTFLVDQNDRDKYLRIADVFKQGKTCYYGGYVHLPVMFGQPPTGHYGDELSRWSNNQMNYANKQDFLIAPFRNEEFDYVILGIPADGSDPSVRAIAEHYTPISKLPGHPRGPQGGGMRYECLVLRAKRLAAPPSVLGGSGTPLVK